MKADTSTRITLAHVAEAAGVSTTTVSLILSGREEWLKQFHPDTVLRVRESSRRLGYRANIFASALPARSCSFFALVIRDIGRHDATSWHHWSFEGDLLAGVMSAAEAEGVHPILTTIDPELDEQTTRRVHRIVDGGVFGTILRTPPPALEPYLRRRLRHGHPTILAFPAKVARWPRNAIDVDNVALGRAAGELLASQHRRRWAVVRYPKLATHHRLRCEGLRERAREHGAEVITLRLPLGYDEVTAARSLTRRLRQLRVDGLFAIDSVASVASLLGCVNAGMKAGEDFSLVGCDCSQWTSAPLPTITSLDVSWKEVGELATRLLVDMARQGESGFDTMLLQPRVTPAETCPAADAGI